MKNSEYLVVEKVSALIKKVYCKLIKLYFLCLESQPTSNTCVIFAPHQDDETLGCGGTIIHKRHNGVAVKVVFMTDGNNSHKCESNIDLSDTRRQEALNSCHVLGVMEEDVIFLNYRDGKLNENHNAAVIQVINILNIEQPYDVFIPYIGDSHADHKATNNIVMSAIKKINKTTTIYEYPTWFLNCWPLVDRKMGVSLYSDIKQGIKFTFKIFRDFKYSINISDVISTKRRALEQHKSQITKMNDNENWFILDEVSNGDWLEGFFQRDEIFCKHIWLSNKL